MAATIFIPSTRSSGRSGPDRFVSVGVNGKVTRIPTGENYVASDDEIAALTLAGIPQMAPAAAYIPTGSIVFPQGRYGSQLSVVVNGQRTDFPTGTPVTPSAQQQAVIDAKGIEYMGASSGGTTPALGTLSLSATLVPGTASTGTIVGATTGSTITSSDARLTVNSAARTYSYDGTGASAPIALAQVLGPQNNSSTITPQGSVSAIGVQAAFAARWTPGLTFSRDTTGSVVAYAYANAGIPTVPASPDLTYYVHAQTGNDTSGTGTAAAPFKTLDKAIQTQRAAATATSKTVIYVDATADVIWRGNTTTSQGAGRALPIGSLYVVNRSAFRVRAATTTNTAAPTFTTVSGSPNLYSATNNSASTTTSFTYTVATVTPVDPSGKAVPSVRNPYIVYIKVADQATCAATPRSWAIDSSNVLYVNCPDGDLTSSGGIYCGVNAGNGTASQGINCVTYYENFDFIGGGSAFKGECADANTPMSVVLKNCTFSGSTTGTGNLVQFRGPVTFYMLNCALNGGGADNLNCHSIAQGGGATEVSPFGYFINSVSLNAGVPTGSTGSNQGVTVHDASAIVTLGILSYGNSSFGYAGGTNYGYMWDMGSTFGGGIYGSGRAIAVGQANRAWLDGTTLVSRSGVAEQLDNTKTAGLSSETDYRNMPKPVALTTDNVVAAY